MRFFKIFIATLIAIAIIVIPYISIKSYLLLSLDKRVQKARVPLSFQLENRYGNIPRLASAVIAYVGKEDDITQPLIAAYYKYQMTNGIEERIMASKNVEMALRNLFKQQPTRYENITQEYEYNISRRFFQVSREMIKKPLENYDIATEQYNAYAIRFPNNLIAHALGLHLREGLYFNPDGTTR